jgi:hypothetical protein
VGELRRAARLIGIWLVVLIGGGRTDPGPRPKWARILASISATLAPTMRSTSSLSVQRAGGRIDIANRSVGGLRQIVELPRATDLPS